VTLPVVWLPEANADLEEARAFASNAAIGFNLINPSLF
jgi:hypothetical protein